MFTITEATVTTSAGEITYWLHRPDHAQASNALLLTFSSTRQSAFMKSRKRFRPVSLPLLVMPSSVLICPSTANKSTLLGRALRGFVPRFALGQIPLSSLSNRAGP